jgi:hypothetical protein
MKKYIEEQAGCEVIFGLIRELQQYIMGSLSGTSVESMQGSGALE